MTIFTDGWDRNATAKQVNETHCECALPPADAEAPVDVLFPARKNHPGEEGTEDQGAMVFAGSVQYVALWTTALSLRPYLSSDQSGGLVVGTHPAITRAAVSMRIEESYIGARNATTAGRFSGFLLDKVPVAGGVATVIPFPLASVPAEAQLLPILVSLEIENVLSTSGGTVLKRRLFLSRVRAPAADYNGSVVQIDYSRKAVVINKSILPGVGFYDVQSIGRANLTRQQAAGLTWNMRYLKSNDPASTQPRKSDSWIQEYLDWSHASGLYVMFDIFFPAEDLFKDPTNFEQHWGEIVDQVDRVKNHPALLGYYVCDDCETQYLEVFEQQKNLYPALPSPDQIYRRLKKLDPYHVVIGAEEAANA